MRPLRHGGTGSDSEQDFQPEFMPDRFESGSHNAIGLAGLSEGVAWILRKTVKALFEHDQALCRAFVAGVAGAEGLRILGPQGTRQRMGVFSVQVDGMGPQKLAERLEREFGILTRAGLHCAPLAHKHLGTVAGNGTTRLSFGPFISEADVKYAAGALVQIASASMAVAHS